MGLGAMAARAFNANAGYGSQVGPTSTASSSSRYIAPWHESAARTATNSLLEQLRQSRPQSWDEYVRRVGPSSPFTDIRENAFQPYSQQGLNEQVNNIWATADARAANEARRLQGLRPGMAGGGALQELLSANFGRANASAATEAREALQAAQMGNAEAAARAGAIQGQIDAARNQDSLSRALAAAEMQRGDQGLASQLAAVLAQMTQPRQVSRQESGGPFSGLRIRVGG